MEKAKKILEIYQNILFLIYPIILILNPKLANNFLIFLLLILVIGNVYVNKKVVFTFYEKFMLIFVIALLISVIFKNVDAGNGFTVIRRHFRWLILPTFLGQLSIKKENLKYMIVSMIIGTLGFTYRFFIELTSIKIQDMSWIKFLTSQAFWNHRFMLQYNLAQTALILGVSFIVLFYISGIIENSKYKKYLYIYSFVPLILMLSTQSRGMLLTIFIMIIFLSILRKEKLIRITAAVIVSASVFSILIFSNSNYISRYENLGKDNSSLARVEVYKESFNMFKENKLTGIGLDSFLDAQNKKSYKYHEEYYHPHNMALNLLAETGLIGFFSYYLLMGSIFLNLWKKYKENKYYLIGILTILSLLIYENVETIFKSVVALPYIFFIIGLNLNSIYREKYEQTLKNKLK